MPVSLSECTFNLTLVIVPLELSGRAEKSPHPRVSLQFNAYRK